MKLIAPTARDCLNVPPNVHINEALVTTINLFTDRFVYAASE